MTTTAITNDELDAALNELAVEQTAWFADAKERQQQEAAKRQTKTSMRIALAIRIGEYLEANRSVTYRARASSPSAGLRTNFMRACPLHN